MNLTANNSSEFITSFALLSLGLLVLGMAAQRIFTNSVNNILFSSEVPSLSDYSLFGLLVLILIIGMIIFILLIRGTANFLNARLNEPTKKEKAE